LRWIAVCCYGYTSQRSEDERMWYLQYLTTVVGYLNAVPSANVIICGGITQPERSISEAADALAAMRDLGLLSYRHSFELEESSKNTEQNIAQAGKIIAKNTQKDVGDTDETEIICDRVRGFRVWVSSRIIFRHLHLLLPSIRGLARPDIHPQSTWFYQTKCALRGIIQPKLVLKRAGLG
jgi:hypothetical protein